MEPAVWHEHHDVGFYSSVTRPNELTSKEYRYYIIYVFQGAGLTGRRGNLIADSVQYVLNVALTGEFLS